MAYDVTQSKTALEAGTIEVPIWILLNTIAVQWDENNFSYRDWLKQYVDGISEDWTFGDQYAPMMPQVGSGGGDTTGAYNNGFNNGFVIGLRLKRR
ncbi:MAG TPA: hypothetical protein VIO64_01835 [Pseudobacteroides sp.]|uniref:hypothetical protein n=1 Tax=Pseudobacteroides sp. TaxID=1968840 RepID=UPI002F93DADD